MWPVATSLDAAVLAKTLYILVIYSPFLSIDCSMFYQAEVEVKKKILMFIYGIDFHDLMPTCFHFVFNKPVFI